MTISKSAAIAVVYLLVMAGFSAVLLLYASGNTSAVEKYAAKVLTITVTPSTNTSKARSPGYVAYNLTVSTNVAVSYIDFTATNASVWTVEFLNDTGVPLPTVASGKPGIPSPTVGKAYYVYTKIRVPSGIANGTMQNHTIYINETAPGDSKAVVLRTICDTFSVSVPHAVVGKALYTNGTDANGAFALLINTATGETSYDTVGPTGVTGVSGNYSTDTSQMPSGCANATILHVIISSTAANMYGSLKIRMDNSTPYQWANVTLNITGAIPAPISPSRVRAFILGGGVNITWEDTGATSYDVYRSSLLNGTGFAQIATVTGNLSAGTIWFVDSGRYGDALNYSWVVSATGNATKSNIAFKLCMPILKPKAPNINWVALPYHTPYEKLKDVARAVNPPSSDANVSELRYWNASLQAFRVTTYNDLDDIWEGTGAEDFITPGMAVMLFARVQFTWKLVGAHNRTITLSILKPKAPNINWLSVPYHGTYPKLKDIARAVNPPSSDANVSELRYWNASLQAFRATTYNDLDDIWEGTGAEDFIRPGMAVMLFAKVAFTWQPKANDP